MKKILIPLAMVVVLALVPFIGVQYLGMSYLFGVIIPYAAVALFVAGFFYRMVDWLGRPVPYNITSTCGQEQSLEWIKQDSIESPSKPWHAAVRVLMEVFLFRSLFRNNKAELRKGPDLVYGSAKWLWLGGLVFHWSLLVIVLRHARFFFVMTPGFADSLEQMDSFFDITLPAFYLTDALVLSAITFLFVRRVTDAKMRIISLPTDYFPLFLLGGIVGAGVLMRYIAKVDVMPVKDQMLRLMSFSFEPPGEIGTLFYVHLFLVCVLLLYFPFSKLVHMGAIFLSPTRTMLNNSREKMHVNPWRKPMRIRTYGEYEDDYREKMKKAKLPIEKE
ncbi:MAG: sulfate reduction electron transfer complex DsrMKJOP subunit DsrM [Chlorobium sp.]|jgi:nitrate reductase gamma subunit|uniref:sulfate reduction electron transfer complex DsrMKJOP subunit DsrM n=1 Tax=Chlorobium sp. TaxID=1095 RepID=UPI001E0AAD39|nr:sulfate reduction electron transfer complex DsrMKJOP subunit DsrM [Chlorobium sp.]MBN1279967.1 sulfate reduction electron transfer complex DsrMKJOP subunit DsrM [Chlorobiaceae bacterium]MCF8215667.1 sulfate reduction electron transfer complex DsrMKJOP subunit DsrM [Chlorobium sp.]MCF8271910.1 sulfate reduction electron transfer complex DsrMKJOP subunit DsrM [Chlorobium sp.]MCF8286876.1 sulfate reduction electron transfer complex DsrMKJOP subunit DsrM [Chlorobium sp.]MCF8291857.1 sulfate red